MKINRTWTLILIGAFVVTFIGQGIHYFIIGPAFDRIFRQPVPLVRDGRWGDPRHIMAWNWGAGLVPALTGGHVEDNEVAEIEFWLGDPFDATNLHFEPHFVSAPGLWYKNKAGDFEIMKYEQIRRLIIRPKKLTAERANDRDK